MTFADEVVARSALAYYKLDDTNTNLLDYTGNGRHLAGGGSFTKSQASLLADASGASWLFNSGYGTLTAASWMDVSYVAVVGRYKPRTADLSGLKPLMTRWTGGGASDYTWHFSVNAGQLFAQVRLAGSGTIVSVTGSSTLVADTAYTVGMSFTGSAVKVYLNGAVDGSTATSGTLTTGSGAPLDMARLAGGVYVGGGTFDEFAMFPASLSDSDHSTLHAAATGSSASPVSVSAPVLAVSVAVPTPTVTAAQSVSVTAPALALVLALAAPVVSLGTSVSVAAPALALTTTVHAPTVVIASDVNVTAPTFTLAAAAPTPTVSAGTSVSVAAPALSLVLALPAPSVDVTGVVTTPIDVGVGVGPVIVTPGGAIPTADLIAPIACGVEVTARFIPKPAPIPLGVLNEWPLERQAHLMPALSAANPRYRPHIDYTVERAEAGRLHVMVGGTDVTYLRNVPADFDDYSSGVPFGPQSARIGMPQVKPWDEDGVGDLAPFAAGRDPSVEICLVRPDDSFEQVWEGFLAVAGDSSGQGREDYTFTAEGIFAQAAHQPHNPPVFMEPTDIGHLVADALNGVVSRRWSAIPRVTTGIVSRNRGKQGQSVWQYAQDLLSQAWTEDGRQWTLARVAPYTYRLQLKTVVTETNWTVTKGAHGVEVNLTRDQSQRRDCIFGRGIAPDGGVWGNWFFPGLDKFNLPLYPMAGFANISVGTSDSETATGRGVSDWQRRMRELGYPVTVDGVMNSADTTWVRKIQAARGVTVDGSLGPQTWAATFDPGMTEQDLTAVRLPLVALPDSEPYLYNANGSKVGPNPLHDSLRVRHAMTEVDFGPGVTKAEAVVLAGRMLERESTPGWSGTITLLTDPHEAGSTRFEIMPGHNVHVVGHHGGVDLQVSEVSVSGLSVTLTVDEKARDALTVDRILERDRDARRDPSGRGLGNDRSDYNRSDVVQFESESQAGTVPRVAVNGNSGLWTVLPIFVSQVGVAKVEFYATEPKAEMCIALFEKPITANRLASFIPDPLADDSGWYDNVDTLQGSFGLMEIWGGSDNPAGYWPRQKVGNPTGPLTGVMKERSGALYASAFGGFVWVAMFTSKSTWVRGRVFPAVPQ